MDAFRKYLEVQKEDRKVEVQCRKCGQVFDLLNEDDANEWYCEHDCEQEN